MSFKSGFITIIGNPNVGKSSLFNKILDFNLSVITKKSQTTRDSIKGIITTDNYQIILSDTPGHIESSYLLHEKMNKNIFSSLEGSDLIIYVTDVKEKKINQKLIDTVYQKKIPMIFIVNKKDLNKNFNIDSFRGDFIDRYLISTKNKNDIQKILNRLVLSLPLHKPYYDSDALTDKNERFIISEIVRGEIFKIFSQEVPYSTHVEINKFNNEQNLLIIEGYIFTESESQKTIIIGKKGKKIKELSTNSRFKIEEMYNKKVFLNFTIKVLKWRNNSSFIKSRF